MLATSLVLVLTLAACSPAPGSTAGDDDAVQAARSERSRRHIERGPGTTPPLPAAPVTAAPSTTVPTAPSTTAPVSAPTTTAPAAPTTPPPTSSVQPPVAAPSGSTWRLAYSEDFAGTSLDRNKLTPCFSWAWSYESCTWSFNNGREYYQPEQVKVADGVARLVAQPDDSTGKKYRSGLLSTTNRPMQTANPASLYKFRYGYVEGRMKLPRERGMFAAFWMLPPDYDRWSYPYEVDIFETLGSTDRTTWMHVHHSGRSASWSANANGNNGACPVHDYADGFHTYGVDWQPSYIDFYIDGRRCGRFTGPVWNGDLEIIANLMVDVDWQKQWGLGLTTPVTGSLDIDYIKVWQHAPAA